MRRWYSGGLSCSGALFAHSIEVSMPAAVSGVWPCQQIHFPAPRLSWQALNHQRGGCGGSDRDVAQPRTTCSAQPTWCAGGRWWPCNAWPTSGTSPSGRMAERGADTHRKGETLYQVNTKYAVSLVSVNLVKRPRENSLTCRL
jgi:hypothetical protein